MNRNNPQKALSRDEQGAVERRASVSMETPTNVSRSTQDLTVGGDEKDPDSHREASTADLHSALEEKNTPPLEPSGEPDGLSSPELAVVRPARAPESGEGSPG